MTLGQRFGFLLQRRIARGQDRRVPIAARAHAHFGDYVAPRTLVFDVREVDATTKRLDVFRLLLAFARDHGVEPARSTLIGARPTDRTLANALGARYVEV